MPDATQPVARFVGRQRELGELQAGLEQALAGHGQLLLLTGEAGIGKTRTAEELLSIATARGARTLWGQCYEWDGVPAFWPWIQIIRGALQSLDAARPRAALDDIAAIAQVLPEFAERAGAPAELPALNPTPARFRLFDSITRFLSERSRHEPLVLVLDDLNWADPASLLLLQFMAQSIRSSALLLLCIYRDVELGDTHPLTATLASLASQRNARRIVLRGLPEAEVAACIAGVAGQEPSPAFVEAVFNETEGNPLFVSEVVRLLIAESGVESLASTPTGSVRLPESVRAVIHRRLSHLPAGCLDLLRVAAVIGSDFRLPLLTRVSRLPTPDLLDRLDEGIRAQVIKEGAAPDSYHFSHDLIRETLYQQLPRAGRLTLHQQIGQALELLHADDLSAHYAELANHFLQAVAGGEIARAADYARKAGDQAVNQGACDTGIIHYQRALQALEHADRPDSAARCDLLLAIGDAQNMALLDSNSTAAQETFGRAAQLARQPGMAKQLARAAIGFAGFDAELPTSGQAQVRLLQDALAMLDTSDSVARANVMARLALALWATSTGAADQISALSDTAVSMARRLNDPETLAFALTCRQSPTWRPDNLDRRLRETAELMELAPFAGDPHVRVWRVKYRWALLMEAGDIAAATRALDTLSVLAEQSRIKIVRWASLTLRAGLTLQAGRFADAEALIERAHRLWPENFDQRFAQTLLLRAFQGQLDDVSDDLVARYRESVEQDRRPTIKVLACVQLLWLDALSGRVDAARAAYDAFTADAFAVIDQAGYYQPGCFGLLAEVCTALNDRAGAAILTERLEPYTERNLASGNCAVFFGAGAYYRGLLATTLNNWDDARRCFETALAIERRMAARPFIARTQLAYARMLIQCNDQADREQAAELLSHARATGFDLGMPLLAAQAAELADMLTSETDPSASMPAEIIGYGLTAREIEVLRLIAAGRSNQQISEALFLSIRTVERHTANLYVKIGAHGRAAATAFALRHHLA